MEIRIFDVEHGFCALVTADNRNIILIDCGHNEQTGFRPSEYLRSISCTGIEHLIISNYDEDHLSDLPNLLFYHHSMPVLSFSRNTSISAEEIYRIKSLNGPIQPSIEALLVMIRNPQTFLHNLPEFPGIEILRYRNPYPTFQDTNNLSLVTFLHYRDVHVVFPGDLERSGWLALVRDQSFRAHLSRINFFVASHHGRESGYCQEVFDYCNPEIIIISDESIQYGTQITNYGRHARGVYFGDRRRYVLSTRNDGMITILQQPDDIPWIYTER